MSVSPTRIGGPIRGSGGGSGGTKCSSASGSAAGPPVAPPGSGCPGRPGGGRRLARLGRLRGRPAGGPDQRRARAARPDTRGAAGSAPGPARQPGASQRGRERGRLGARQAAGPVVAAERVGAGRRWGRSRMPESAAGELRSAGRCVAPVEAVAAGRRGQSGDGRPAGARSSTAGPRGHSGTSPSARHDATIASKAVGSGSRVTRPSCPCRR